jgi:hypothetical protein
MSFLTSINPLTGPSVAWIVLGVVVSAGGFGFYGGHRWSEANVVKCELEAKKKEAAQAQAVAKETKRQTTASNKAASGLEADRGALQTQFQEVRDEQQTVALAQPDRANLECFDAEWLRLDAAATRAANGRSGNPASAPQALPATPGAKDGHSGEPAVQPNPASGALRGLPRDPPTPSAVDQAPRGPEKN